MAPGRPRFIRAALVRTLGNVKSSPRTRRSSNNSLRAASAPRVSSRRHTRVLAARTTPRTCGGGTRPGLQGEEDWNVLPHTAKSYSQHKRDAMASLRMPSNHLAELQADRPGLMTQSKVIDELLSRIRPVVEATPPKLLVMLRFDTAIRVKTGRSSTSASARAHWPISRLMIFWTSYLTVTPHASVRGTTSTITSERGRW